MWDAQVKGTHLPHATVQHSGLPPILKVAIENYLDHVTGKEATPLAVFQHICSLPSLQGVVNQFAMDGESRDDLKLKVQNYVKNRRRRPVSCQDRSMQSLADVLSFQSEHAFVLPPGFQPCATFQSPMELATAMGCLTADQLLCFPLTDSI